MNITITKKFGDKVLFDRQTFSFSPTKITCVLGESGLGKTTLLRAMAGLEPFEGERDECTPSVAFQEPRLLPFSSPKENLTYVGVAEKDAEKWLDWVELGGVDKDTKYLSGGEKQRVALARALAKAGDLLLLDEPFSSVDTARKIRLCEKLRKELKAEGRTTVYVTHDVDEALLVADEILLLQDGATFCFDVAEEDRSWQNSPLRAKIYQKILSKG